MIKAVIFDLDNTLTDFMLMKHESVKAAVAAMLDAGLDMKQEDVHAGIMDIYRDEGIEYQEVFDHFLKQHYGKINHKILASSIVAYRHAREATLTLYPHVISTLSTLAKRGVKLAILTDAPPKQAWLRLCSLNLQHLFDVVITPEETGVHKPSPLAFRAAMDVLKVKKDEVIMVGDWPERDLVGARNFGIRSVFARYGDSHSVVDSGADFDIDDISELLNIVRNG